MRACSPGRVGGEGGGCRDRGWSHGGVSQQVSAGSGFLRGSAHPLRRRGAEGLAGGAVTVGTRVHRAEIPWPLPLIAVEVPSTPPAVTLIVVLGNPTPRV